MYTFSYIYLPIWDITLETENCRVSTFAFSTTKPTKIRDIYKKSNRKGESNPRFAGAKDARICTPKRVPGRKCGAA
jgi:hypothetical protein